MKEEKPTVDEDDRSILPATTSADVRSDKVLGRKDKLNAASGVDSKKSKLAKTSAVISDNSSKMKKQNLGNKTGKRKGKPTELQVSSRSCNLHL